MRHVVYLTDENYAMPTCVSIVSLIKNNTSKSKYKVHILVNNVETESVEKMKQLDNEDVICDVIDISNDKYKTVAEMCLSKGIHVSDTALFKFDIPNILSDVDEVLYLDSDVIVNKDLSDLFATDISEVYLAAVDDMGDKFSEDGKSMLASRIGIGDRNYFNSGVMYLNLKKMRAHNICEKLLKYRVEKPNYFMDQDALNAIIGERRKGLSYAFNFRMPIFDELDLVEVCRRFGDSEYRDIETCLDAQVIIHMTDKRKPWEYNVPWATEMFLLFYKQTPYRDKTLHLKSYVKAISEKMVEMQNELLSVNQRKIWPFPYEKIEKGSKVIIYGAGDVGCDMYHQIKQTGYCKLSLWVDKKWMERGEDIQNPEDIRNYNYDYILISVMKDGVAREIVDDLLALGVEDDKMVVFNKRYEDLIK